MIEVTVSFEPKSRARARARAEAATAVRRHPARIARQLALAHALQRRVEQGEFRDYADMARALGFTRARITQLMDLLLLAPSVQDEILHLELPAGAPQPTERALRRVLRTPVWEEQRRRWTGSRQSASAAEPTIG
jgi:hypothetical protein